MLRAAGVCVTGPAHLEAGEPGQDALSLRGWCGGWLAAVADGLGSRPMSAQGARLAVQAAQTCLRARGSQALDIANTRAIATEVYRHWLRQRPGYGNPSQAACTLLAAACDAQGRVQTWQIGDGMVVACLGGQVQVLTPGRTGFGNQTQALGVDKQWSAWQTAQLHLRRPGDLVLLMTDGVADDLPEAALPGFVRALHRELQHRNRRQARQWLRHELTYWATPGHSDDKTLVVIYKDEQHGKSREDEYGRQQEAAVGS